MEPKLQKFQQRVAQLNVKFDSPIVDLPRCQAREGATEIASEILESLQVCDAALGKDLDELYSALCAPPPLIGGSLIEQLKWDSANKAFLTM